MEELLAVEEEWESRKMTEEEKVWIRRTVDDIWLRNEKREGLEEMNAADKRATFYANTSKSCARKKKKRASEGDEDVTGRALPQV